MINDKKDARFSDYLFAKMSSRNSSNGQVVVGIENDRNISTKSKTTTLHFSDKETESAKKSEFKKWLLDNLMLLVTLSGVFLGVILGEFCGWSFEYQI
jgi:hypothetical protein